jgi:hypothetical protein
MVKHLIFLFLLLPSLLSSAEFVSSVNRNKVGTDENFFLTLTLKDAAPQGAPGINVLKQFFTITSQQQSSNTSITNGRRSSSSSWKIGLRPLREGEITIPAISINSSAGTIESNPIQISVNQENLQKSPEMEGMTVTTNVSKENPYKNETITFSTKLISKYDLAEVGIPKFTIENAIVEAYGEPKIEKRIVDGLKVNVVEFNYLITPLTPGQLKIPSSAIHGGIPERRKRRGSFFDDDFDSFFMMPGFEQVSPFALRTKEVILNVLPPIAGLIPWIPANSLKIEENWNDSQLFQAGEPITLGFKISAEGIMASQLPSLESQLKDIGFKVYADKPEIENKISNGKVYSVRKEQFTLIPQQPGELTFPEIAITWWDVSKNERAYASIPSRTIHVQPGQQIEKSPYVNVESKEHNDSVPAMPSSTVQRDPLVYVLVGVLALLLLSAIVWVITLQKRILKLTKKPSDVKIAPKPPEVKVKAPAKDKKEKLPDLNPT